METVAILIAVAVLVGAISGAIGYNVSRKRAPWIIAIPSAFVGIWSWDKIPPPFLILMRGLGLMIIALVVGTITLVIFSYIANLLYNPDKKD